MLDDKEVSVIVLYVSNCKLVQRKTKTLTESITDLKVILSSEKPSMEAPAGFLTIPVDLNRDADERRRDRIYLAITRDPNNNSRPITDVTVIQGDSASIRPPSGYTKLPEDLNENASGDYIFLCYRRGSGVPVADIVFQSTNDNDQDTPVLEGDRYIRDNVDLNDNAGGDYIYLYYLKKQPDEIPDFNSGINAELLNTPNKEYEVGRIQIDYEKSLVWVKKVEILQRDTISPELGRRYEVTKYEGMSETQKESFSEEMGIGVGLSYSAFSAEINYAMGQTSENSFTTTKIKELKSYTDLPTVDYTLTVAFAEVIDILRIVKIPTGKKISEAISYTIDSGVFIKNQSDDWG